MQHKSLSLLIHAQWRLLLFHKCDLIIAWPKSEQHQRQWDSVEGLDLRCRGAFHCQMKCDSWERTQQQLMGLKWEQKDLCIISFGVATAGRLCGKYNVDAQGQCLCNEHFSRMLFKYDHSFLSSLSNNNLTFAKEASRLCRQMVLEWLQNLCVCRLIQSGNVVSRIWVLACGGRSAAATFVCKNVHQ